MKKMNKFWALLGGAALLTLGACTETVDYDAPAPETGMGVHMAGDIETTLDLASDKSEYTITFYRLDDAAAVSVPVTVTQEDDWFVFPSSVSFAAGAKSAPFTFTYDPDTLEFDTYTTVTITIDPEYATTAYGIGSKTFQIGKPIPWVSLGKGKFADWRYCMDYHNVEIQMNDINHNEFRLVNPYNIVMIEEEYYDDEDYDGADPYLVFDILKVGSTLGGVPITHEGLVYYVPTNTGYYNTNYDSYEYIYHPVYMTSTSSSEDYWLVNSVQMWQSYKGTTEQIPAYVWIAPFHYMPGVGGWNHSTEPYVEIIFPGVVIGDFWVEVEYTGRYTDLRGNNYAVAQVEGGEDISYIEVGIGAGEDPNAILSAMLAGDESVSVVRVTGNAGQANLPVPEDGTYTIVAVGYGTVEEDADPEAQDVAYTTFEFVTGGSVEFNPLDWDWTSADIYYTEKEEILKTWDMYARDQFVDPSTRVFFNEVTFEDAEDGVDEEGEEIDYIAVTGFDLGYADEESMLWEYYGGVAYMLDPGLVCNVTVGGEPYSVYWRYPAGSSIYSGSYALFAGIVEEGYMALVDAETGIGFKGVALAAYDAENQYAGMFEYFTDIMFVDPALETAAGTHNLTKKDLKSLAAATATRSNYVESNRGYIRSRIDALRAAKRTEAPKAARIVPASDNEQLRSGRGRAASGFRATVRDNAAIAPWSLR